MDKALQFLREVKGEMKKVSWPNRQEIINSTIVIILTVAIVVLYIGVVDLGITSALSVIMGFK